MSAAALLGTSVSSMKASRVSGWCNRRTTATIACEMRGGCGVCGSCQGSCGWQCAYLQQRVFTARPALLQDMHSREGYAASRQRACAQGAEATHVDNENVRELPQDAASSESGGGG